MISRFAGMLTVALVGIAIAPAAMADLPAILACAAQTDPQQRLACYDSEAAKLKSELTEAQTRKNTLFGFNIPFSGSDDSSDHPAEPKLGPPEVNEVDAKLLATSKDIGGHLILALNNKQVWRIDDAHVPLLVPGKDLISVVRNDFGGYYLSVNGRDNKYSVTRIK